MISLSQTERALALVFVFSSGSNWLCSQSGMNLWQKSSASQNICVTFMSGNLFDMINIFITAYILSCFKEVATFILSRTQVTFSMLGIRSLSDQTYKVNI